MSKGFDEAYKRISDTEYRVQAPQVTMKEKLGTCVDIAVVMKHLLDPLNVPNQIRLLRHKVRGSFHVILTFCADEKYVYPELTPQSKKPHYGKELISDSEKSLVAHLNREYLTREITSQVVIGERPRFAAAYERSCGAVVYTVEENVIKYVLVQQKDGFSDFPKGHIKVFETEDGFLYEDYQ